MKYLIYKHKKGFTLIELIVVMTIIGVLVLLVAPRFLGRTDDANTTKHVSNARTLEDASERYYMDHGDWPRLTDDAYDSDSINAYAERILDTTGVEVELSEGNYYDIDYEALQSYASLPAADDLNNYILRNPIGKIYYMEGLSEEGMGRVARDQSDSDTGSSQNQSGKVMSVMTYENDSEEIVFQGLSPEAYDGDENTFHTSSGHVSWTGNLAHREIEVVASGNGNRNPLLFHFEDDNGNAVSPSDSLEKNFVLSTDSPDVKHTHTFVVPELATKMVFHGTNVGRIFNISVPTITERPTDATLTSTSTPSSITLNWDAIQRAVIRKNGELLANVNGQSFEDTPLYAGTSHRYDVILIDDYGNGQNITFEANTTTHIVAFRGLSPAAFDGDDDTFHTGSGKVTWTGDLAHREIEVVASGNGARNPMSFHFEDDNGNAVSPSDSPEEVFVLSEGAVDIRTRHTFVVPELATQMVFHGTNAGRVFNINLPETSTRPDDINITSNSTPSGITLNWDTVSRAIVRKNGQLLENVSGQTYTDTPLYPDSEHIYELILIDSYGNGRKQLYTNKTTTHVVAFRGLSPAAFDDNEDTYHTGSGTVTWNGDLANHKIKIVGSGNGSHNPMYVRFLNENGNAIIPAGETSEEILISSDSPTIKREKKLVIPEDAASIQFFGTNAGRIFNIQVID